jgi:hypothetical protein
VPPFLSDLNYSLPLLLPRLLQNILLVCCQPTFLISDAVIVKALWENIDFLNEYFNPYQIS